MDWAEDFKFSLKKSAKKGRRAGAGSTSTTAQDSSNVPLEKPGSGTSVMTPEQEISLFDKEFDDDDMNDFDVKQMMKTKKTGGWADEPVKYGKKSNINLIEQERFNSITSTSNLSDDDIPVIPDLDDIKDEMILNEMVEAPTVSVNRVATYKELNSDLLKQGAFAALEDVDLSILAKSLQNEMVLNEPDEVWTWEKLFTDISAEIHSEKPQSAVERRISGPEVMTKYVE